MPNCSLLLVGDRDQLPSVGTGQRAKGRDRVGPGAGGRAARSLPAGAREQIVANAHRAQSRMVPRRQQSPEGDFFFFERASPDEVVATIKQLVQQRLVGRFGISDPREIQVLTPMNRGPLGTHLAQSRAAGAAESGGTRAACRRQDSSRRRPRNPAPQQLRQGRVQRIDRPRDDGRSAKGTSHGRVRGDARRVRSGRAGRGRRLHTRSRCTRARAASIRRS